MNTGLVILRRGQFETGHLITTLTEHEHTVGSVAFSPDGTTLATASDDSTAKIWRVGD
ncbi:MAG: hypothetical protein BUE48_006925 [Thermomonospora sp. CIF 1]|nr:MAG: hypothetical protein BUE48_006925 [Thermomonospora sp. CIF 1]